MATLSDKDLSLKPEKARQLNLKQLASSTKQNQSMIGYKVTNAFFDKCSQKRYLAWHRKAIRSFLGCV
jgi:hypothetical protein